MFNILTPLFVLFGLIIGSFISLLTWRLPRNLNFIKGRSVCPKCKKTIAWYDNIPLISYILLRGKCRNCKKKISIRYPLIEVATSVIFALIYLTFVHYGFLTIIFYLVISSILICIFVIDFERKLIPDWLSFFGFLLIFIYFLLTDSPSLFLNLFSGFIASLFLLLLHLITKGKGMGLGDVKFALFGGFLIGLINTINWLFLAFLTGAAVGIILIIVGKAKLKQKIAFGPFLVFTLFIEILFGPFILKLFGLL